jgi:hypothetical protein
MVIVFSIRYHIDSVAASANIMNEVRRNKTLVDSVGWKRTNVEDKNISDQTHLKDWKFQTFSGYVNISLVCFIRIPTNSIKLFHEHVRVARTRY